MGTVLAMLQAGSSPHLRGPAAAISRARLRRHRRRSSFETASRRVSPERCPAKTNHACRPPTQGSRAERRGAVNTGGAGTGAGVPCLDRWRGAAHLCITHWDLALSHPCADPSMGTSLSSPQHYTYIESLFPQGWRVRWALVVGGEPLVHCGGLVHGAGR